MRPYLTLHTPDRARAYYRNGRWADDTFYSLLDRWARDRPESIALRDGQVALSWRQLKGRVDSVAALYRRHDLVAGDRVSIWMSNKVESVIAFLACSREGLACNPSLHRSYTCQEIVDLLTRLNTRLLLCEEGWGADRDVVDFESMIGALPFLRACYSPRSLAQAEGAIVSDVVDDAVSEPNPDPDCVAYLAFTSGTTGTPKCVMHSANTLLSNGRDLVEAWEIDSDQVLLSLSPLSHHIAWVAVAQWLLAGCVLVTDDPPAHSSRFDWIVETAATFVMGVPTHAMDILAEQRARGMSAMGEVEVFYMAGSPIPEVVAESFVQQGIKPLNVYGMTENSSHQFTHPNDRPDVWTSTCGKGGRGYEVKIFTSGNTDVEAQAGEVGQIAGRGSNLMLGYFGAQEATENSFNSSGWFLSGDLGSFDEEGNLRIDGRVKDLIIRGGHNIYPIQIEWRALRHEKIELAAAFSVPDDRLGERVGLAIKGQLDASETLQYLVEQGVSKYDMPEWFVQLEDFPLTASGKILKRELVALCQSGAIQLERVKYKVLPGQDGSNKPGVLA